MYYIYHIPERNKIGLTENLKVRMKKQKWTGPYEILEEHTCEFKASDREVELQIEYYGKRDSNALYWQTLKVLSAEGRAKGGSTQGRRNVESGHAARLGKLPSYSSRRFTYEQAEYIRAQYKRGKDVFGKRISQRRLSRVFDIGLKSIQLILQNKTYTTP